MLKIISFLCCCQSDFSDLWYIITCTLLHSVCMHDFVYRFSRRITNNSATLFNEGSLILGWLGCIGTGKQAVHMYLECWLRVLHVCVADSCHALNGNNIAPHLSHMVT